MSLRTATLQNGEDTAEAVNANEEPRNTDLNNPGLAQCNRAVAERGRYFFLGLVPGKVADALDDCSDRCRIARFYLGRRRLLGCG